MTSAGLLLVDKAEGPTSHDVVVRVRHLFGTRRVGHAGTLDPFASGLLLLCIGWATRLAEYLAALPKTYSCVIRLGSRTDTDDRTGAVIAEGDAWRDVDLQRVKHAAAGLLGEIDQLPPMYSAKKVAGRRAYRIARRGGTPRLDPQRVTIRRFEIRDFSPPDVTAEVDCSTGTYIRALARDLGEELGVGAHLAGLRRLYVGRFAVADALALDSVQEPGDVLDRLRPPEAAASHLARVELEPSQLEDLRHGRAVRWDASSPAAGDPVAVFTPGGLVAIAEWRDGWLRPRKVFAQSRAGQPTEKGLT